MEWNLLIERIQNEQKDLIFESINSKGIVTMNRPVALNAFTAQMIDNLTQVLLEWEKSHDFVILKSGGGKAFCSGGDVKEMVKAGNSKMISHYRGGYNLNYLIYKLRIPYIALMDGITFGGGIGLSIYGRFRVATEKSLLAMPETTIGFFPDCGSSYFFPRIMGGKFKLGLYLALTGHRLNGSDAFHTGLATHMCSSDLLGALQHDLVMLNSAEANCAGIEKVLLKYQALCPHLTSQPFTLENHMEKIDRIFCGESMEEVFENLRNEAKSCQWTRDLLGDLSKLSPTALKITFKLQKMGQDCQLWECLNNECLVAEKVCTSRDFIEGITAKVIEKRAPKWNPPTLEQVSDSYVDSFFEPQSPYRPLLSKL